MRYTDDRSIQKKLEDMLDSGIPLSHLLGNLAQVCFDKAEYLRATWQDETTGKAWERAGKRIDRFAFHDDINTL